jgi:hypothetical protein
MNASGQIQANFSYNIGNLELTVQGQVAEEAGQSGVGLDVDYRLGQNMLQAKVMLGHSAVALTRAFRRFDIGTEGVFIWNDGPMLAALGGALRYRLNRRSVFTSKLNSMGQATFGYSIQLAEKFHFGTEVALDASQPEAALVPKTDYHIGFEYKLLNACALKVYLDSDGRLCSNYEEHISPHAKIHFSSNADLTKNKFGFGYGMSLAF